MNFNGSRKVCLGSPNLCIFYFILMTICVEVISCVNVIDTRSAEISPISIANRNHTTLGGNATKPNNTSSLDKPNLSKVLNMCSTIGNICKLKCENIESDAQLNNLIENQSTICKGPLDLELIEIRFKSNTFKKTDLQGNFKLNTLIFDMCELDKIENNAFNKSSMHDLVNLRIISSKIENMNNETFAGLSKLKTFELENIAKENGEFEAVGMLKPMELTLTELIFQHNSSQFLKDFNPGDWLQGASLYALSEVYFYKNYFTNKLNGSSFITLKGVVTLSLKLCAINYVADDTFDPILNTLKHLDLSQNELKILSPHFLQNAANQKIELVLGSNDWDCHCDNMEFMEAITDEDIDIKSILKCTTPAHFQNIEIKLIKQCCIENNQGCNALIPTTPEPTATVYLNCKSKNDNQFWKKTVKDTTCFFEIVDIFMQAVIVKFHRPCVLAESSLIYFSQRNRDNYGMSTVDNSDVIIYYLNLGECYLFCLSALRDEHISPFNCRSHYIPPKVILNDTRKGWLTNDDRPIFIALVTIFTVICCFIGIFCLYMLLRWRPKILAPHQRLEILNSKSNQVFLKDTCTKLTAAEIQKALRMYALIDSSDHGNYYQSTQLSTRKIQATNLYGFAAPCDRAPALPPLENFRKAPSLSTIPADNVFFLDSINEDLNEPEYQSLELYQEIYAINNE